ncbi:hypothetical protein D3C71_1213430 [compost metagenome]
MLLPVLGCNPEKRIASSSFHMFDPMGRNWPQSYDLTEVVILNLCVTVPPEQNMSHHRFTESERRHSRVRGSLQNISNPMT